MQFHNLNVNQPLLRIVKQAGYTEPTPIQSQTIPHILDGRDIVGCAQTGTGKTAAFVLPIVQMLDANTAKGSIRVLVLAPTRELAAQIDEEFDRFSRAQPAQTCGDLWRRRSTATGGCYTARRRYSWWRRRGVCLI